MGKLAWMAALLYGAASFCASPLLAATASGPAFVALILPTKSKALKLAAEAIKAGVLAQEKVAGNADLPQVRLFETGDRDEDAVDQFVKAWEAGASAVIGPLTRSALNDMANKVSNFPVPVVGLNSFDDTAPRRVNLYSLSLSVEAEAAQVAQWMRNEGIQKPAVIQNDSVLSRRIAQGFAEGWGRGAGSISVRDVRVDGAGLADRLGSSDAAFLAMDARAASQIRPYLGNDRPVFATSQIDPGRQSGVLLIDLAGTRYLDAPWLVNAENPDYAAYLRVRSSSNDVERLFALGADAWRVALALLQGLPVSNLPGISGRLTLQDDRVILRELQQKTLAVRMAVPVTESASQVASAPSPFRP